MTTNYADLLTQINPLQNIGVGYAMGPGIHYWSKVTKQPAGNAYAVSNTAPAPATISSLSTNNASTSNIPTNTGTNNVSNSSNVINDIVNAMMQKGYNDRASALATALSDPERYAREYLGTGSSSNGNQEAINAANALNALRNSVNTQYDQVFAVLDEMAGRIPQQRAEREANLANLYNAQQNEINTAMQGSLGALDASRANVKANQVQSVRDLQDNLRKMLQAANIQLGIGGAGDSSAANMYAYALSKQAGRGSADISNQASRQYAAIDAQAQQIRATADDQLAKLETWKATNLDNIVVDTQNRLDNIQAQKANATGQRAAALTSAEQSIINNALTQLQKIGDQATQWQQALTAWTLDRMATLDDAKLQISGLGKYDVADIVANELKGLGNLTSNPATSSSLYGYNPYSPLKKQYENFLSGY